MKCYMTGRPCDYYKTEVTNRRMFLIFPFGFPFDSLYSEGDDKTDQSIRGALKRGFGLAEANRSDRTMRLGSIMCQGICKEIIESQYLYADISLPNPNVYYEMGLAYALSRSLIVASSASANSYSAIFAEAWKNEPAYLRYTDVASLRAAIEKMRSDLQEAPGSGLISLARAKGAATPPGTAGGAENEKRVLIVENGDGSVGGLYQDLLDRQQKQFDFDQDLTKMLSQSEKNAFKAEDWKRWEITTLRIADSTPLSEIVGKIRAHRICIVDTTSYRGGAVPVTNPYMYFCLGIAHGFEKDVIPITNTLHSSGAPFDVKGLWHIFFSKEEELTSGFSKIIPRISIEFHKELSDAPYRMIWNDFLSDKQTLSVIYCGRPVGRDQDGDEDKTRDDDDMDDDKDGDGRKGDETYRNRGPRTNVDSWDTKAVSEVSFYLAQKYPTSLIKPSSPKTKITKADEAKAQQIGETLGKELGSVYHNCVIIGSPDVNDYAEVVLSKLFHLTPFSPRRDPDFRKSGGFIFHKNNIKKDINSAFYSRNKNNAIEYVGGRYNCSDDPHVTYGVLTIAQNPFAERGRVMVLSGFTGIATCGLMDLVIESEPGEGEIEFKQRLKERLVKEILPLYNKNKEENERKCKENPQAPTVPFFAVIKFEFEVVKGSAIGGDNRRLRNATVI
jgi:hypothetical protein